MREERDVRVLSACGRLIVSKKGAHLVMAVAAGRWEARLGVRPRSAGEEQVVHGDVCGFVVATKTAVALWGEEGDESWELWRSREVAGVMMMTQNPVHTRHQRWAAHLTPGPWPYPSPILLTTPCNVSGASTSPASKFRMSGQALNSGPESRLHADSNKKNTVGPN